MNYRSIANLADTIRENLYKIPADVDLVVGIPRSGMLAANIIALNCNLKFCDTESYISDKLLEHGRTRSTRTCHINKPSDAKHVLFIDDSVFSGETIQKIKIKASNIAAEKNQKITFAAIYAVPKSINCIDIFLEIVKPPRAFEWNLMHRPILAKCCLDIDGVLCVDPTAEENDDGDAYREFLFNTKPLAIPSYRVGNLVTSRLEKYRIETEAWLEKHGIMYDQLHMLDLPDAVTRRQLNCHASFKGQVYRKLKDTILFIESDPNQALIIANQSGKPALCFKNQKLYSPVFSYQCVEQKTRTFSKRIAGKINGIISKFTMA